MDYIMMQFQALPNLVKFSVYTLIFVLVYQFFTKWIERRLNKKKFFPVHTKFVIRVWRVFFFIIYIVFVVVFAKIGDLSTLGVSAAFLGMLLGWSLQAPVTGVAAWLLVISLHPFKIGDRVIIAGTIGDVRNIGPMYITLEQVGGTVGGEEQSGRAILIPTAVLFGQVITNYRLDFKYRAEEMEDQNIEEGYILDEVPVRITFETNWDKASEILINCALEITSDAISNTGKKPFIRSEFLDWGVLIRLRYYVKASQRQKVSSDIVEKVFKKFATVKDVQFAYPHSEVIYRANIRE
ncbi:MAG: hypothetical protein A2452_03590 [Candidatus Firestonebacteria bacterium RIFOXYC2_FULL_39_67]|nr:MAG: hypothetical protein A2536_00415 [Candidatus Firestonebacteria bacterium RIFOXYD2_FULL_39_29]OGF51942.1 MAG: hypothetical protein A2497_07670 [Candidatus Firestonebacteria bacterium RifOxyC12_full_39_7]OGF57086.1 MAG: hypothetical protein A2452_03590 [Candidatus Firestonebacteria bacterium RIFOXYC2_FULL_39_67]